MSEFKREISNQLFINKLNINPYFNKMREDKDLFIAIRKEYLNVYYYGQSICKIEFKNKQIKWTTHKKYLGIDEKGYADAESHLNDLEKLKLKAKKYGGKEKEQVKKHILENNELCVLDVEVAFSRDLEKLESKGGSIDYLTIEKEDNGKIKLVFYEAKHFTNKEISAPKARPTEIPAVFDQIKKYELFLNDHKSEILNTYKNIYKNINELNLGNKIKLSELIGKNIDNIEIDFDPRLIIFEINPNEINSTDIQKLAQKFGKKRLILIDKNGKKIS